MDCLGEAVLDTDGVLQNLGVQPVSVGRGTGWSFSEHSQHNGMRGKGSSMALLGVVLCTSLRVGIQKSGFYMYLLGG